jgi:hypothetical protein
MGFTGAAMDDTYDPVAAFRKAIDAIIEQGEDAFYRKEETDKPICGLCAALSKQGFLEAYAFMFQFMKPDPEAKYICGIGPDGVLNEERIFVVLLLDQLEDADILAILDKDPI